MMGLRFPEDNPNPIIEVNLATRAVEYANPFAVQLFPDLQNQGIEHPFLAGLQELAKPLLDGKMKALHREVVLNDSCFAQTLSVVPDSQRVRVYSNDITERSQAEQELHTQ